jgi:putative addiction module component (TIGR02574 family)
MVTLPGSIRDLSDAEKYDLIDALWQDLAGRFPGLSAEQAEELDRRVDDYHKNPSEVLSWEQVKAAQPKL